MNKKTMAAGTLVTVLLLAMLASPAAAIVTANMHVSPDWDGGVDYMYDENGDKLRGDGAYMPGPETSFLIGGYVFDSDDSPCNGPGVRITSGDSWTATTSAQSNYYRLVLDSGNVSMGDTLHLDASGYGQSKSVTHPVTQDEIDDGGIFNLNITLGSKPINSCNDTGEERNAFCPGDNVSVKGSGLLPETNYTLWIQDDPVCEGYVLCAENATYGDGAQVPVRTDANGSFGPTLLWSIPETASITHDRYDIVADEQDDGEDTGRYNALSDCIDDAETHGIVAPIPEMPSIVLLAVGLLGLALLVRRRNERN